MARPRKPLETRAEGASLTKNLIAFGRVAGPYGVRGWLRVAVDEPEVLAGQPTWWLAGAGYEVQETREHSGALLAKLAGIESPEQAKSLRGEAVRIPRPAAGEGRYYWDDLVGLEVVNSQGLVLGVVKGMFSNGAHDVMELAGSKDDARQRLLPFVPAYVKKIDLPGRRIEVEWEAEW